MVKPAKFSGKEDEDPQEWIEEFNRAAITNNWTGLRKLQIVGGYLQGMAAIWYDQHKHLFFGWDTVPNGFEPNFLAKFASPTMRKTWYTNYKNVRQNGRSIDEYNNEFQAKWRKIDRNRAIPTEAVINDFIEGLDGHIKLSIYQTFPVSVEDAAQKAKMIELGQKSAAVQLGAQARMTQLEQENMAYRLQLNNIQETSTPSPPNNKWNNPPPDNKWNNPNKWQNRNNNNNQNNRFQGGKQNNGKGYNPNWNRPRIGGSNGNPPQNQTRPFNGDCHNCGKKGHMA